MLDSIPDTLIDHNLIDRADAKLLSVQTRRKAAADNLETVRAVLTAANRNSEQAAHGRGSLSPEAAELELESAQRAMRVAEKVLSAAEATYQKVADWVPLAKGAAYGRVYMAGVQRRIAAAKKADDAKKLAEEAEQDFKAAVQMCNEAHAGGHQHLRAIINGSHLLTSEAQELSVWHGNNADPFSRTNEWVEHVLSQEPEEV